MDQVNECYFLKDRGDFLLLSMQRYNSHRYNTS